MLDLIRNTGSLIENATHITSSFDISNSNRKGKITRLLSKEILNFSVCNFNIDYTKSKFINVINGMGVTLGDSIIGIGALDCIKKINKNNKINLIRPETCHSYVDEIYKIATTILDKVEYMPYEISRLAQYDINIDIGNQLFWSDFSELEMHDFFLRSLGINHENIPEEWKQNHWLQTAIPKENRKSNGYVMFCPKASTNLRTIPDKYHFHIFNQLSKKFKLPIVGFSSVCHPNFTDVTNQCNNTSEFIKMIANSSYVYTCDSSALHISAAYDIPTLCIFTSIRPELRSRYYKNCESIYIGDKLTDKLHETECQSIINHVEEKFEAYYERF